jgi:hypothetical protein
MTSKNRLLQSDYLSLSNYKSIEGANDIPSTAADNLSKAPITPNGNDKKDLFKIDGKISNLENEHINIPGNPELSEEGTCYKIFCSGLNMVIFTGIGLCLIILLIMLMMSK